MKQIVILEQELFYEVVGTLESFLLLLEEGIQQPHKKGEIMQVQKLLAVLSKAGKLGK